MPRKTRPGLLGALARVADPRHRRGVRHRLAVILGLAVGAVVKGETPDLPFVVVDGEGEQLEPVGAYLRG